MKQWQVRLQKSRSYKWWVLAVIMVGTFMAVLDVTVVNVGLPTIMNVFHIGLSTAEWVVTAYMITMTIMLPTAGWLADRYGNKRIYVLGMILFTFGSWCCGRATVDEFLIFSRALQGVGSRASSSRWDWPSFRANFPPSSSARRSVCGRSLLRRPSPSDLWWAVFWWTITVGI